MKKLFIFLATVICFINAQAEILLVENFDYTIGSNLTDNGWTAHSGVATQSIDVITGLGFAGYAGSGIGGAANLDNNGEDVHRTFNAQTSGTVYAAFIIQTQSTNSAGYFIHFGQNPIGSTFYSRIWINSTGDGIGLGQGTNPPTNYIDISTNTPVLIVTKYDYLSRISSLYAFDVFPDSEPDTADATYTNSSSYSTGSIALRQYNASQKVTVDGIRVATSWSEAVLATGGNMPPIISNIVQEPADNITSTTAVSVSADVTDTGRSIASVSLKWGTTSLIYPNSINMTFSSEN
ncbi:MAG: hypothetical protein PHR06_10485 [Candidatus Cloacimonetes bacterium]|nr:hypothetical protein [Candidatus Cloacimonadota bacterium]